MANKRQLKKRISAVCGELAGEILLASHLFESVDNDKVYEIVNEIAELQIDALGKATFSFDKVVRDFDTPAEYRKARHAYESKAYAQLRKEFNEKVVAIVKEMNAVIPAEVRKTMSKLG